MNPHEKFLADARKVAVDIIEAIENGDLLSLAVVATVDEKCDCEECGGRNAGMVCALIESSDVDALHYLEKVKKEAHRLVKVDRPPNILH